MSSLRQSLFAFVLLFTLGAGCSLPAAKDATVSGPWYLVFTTPEGWVMAVPYTDSSGQPFSTAVNRGHNEVWLQSINEKVTRAEGQEYLRIAISQYDVSRKVPDWAKDEGAGFYSANVCDNPVVAECTPKEGYSSLEYYLKTEDTLYRFIIDADGEHPTSDDLTIARDIILSAQEVTEFTDRSVVEVGA